MSSTHIDEMSDALAANIEYLKENGSSQITLRNGDKSLKIYALKEGEFEVFEQ